MAYKTNAAERKSDIVRCRQLLVLLKTLVEILSDCRIGAISTNENVAVGEIVVGASDHRNAVDEQVIKVRSRNDVLSVTNTRREE